MKDCLTLALFMIGGCFADGDLTITMWCAISGAILQYDKIEAILKK